MDTDNVKTLYINNSKVIGESNLFCKTSNMRLVGGMGGTPLEPRAEK